MQALRTSEVPQVAINVKQRALLWMPALAVALLAVSSGCKSKPKAPGGAKPGAKAGAAKSTPKPNAKPKPKPVPLPAGLAKTVSTAPLANGLLMESRVLLSQLTPEDSLRIAIGWAAPKRRLQLPRRYRRGPTGSAGLQPNPLGLAVVDWPATVASLRLTVTRAGGKRVKLAPRHGKNAIFRPELGAHRGLSLQLAPTALLIGGNMFPWKGATPPKLAPGRYSVRVSVSLVFAELRAQNAPKAKRALAKSRSFRFESPELPFVVHAVSAAWRPVAKLVGAKAAINAWLAKRGKAQDARGPASGLIHDDAKGVRRLRFRGGSRGKAYPIYLGRFTPSGRLLGVDVGSHTYCLFAGTRVSTPRGSRAVEGLRVGDVLWGYDPARRRRVRVTLQAVRASQRRSVVRVGRARLTPEHPVWTGERFVAAGDLPTRARLLVDDDGVPRWSTLRVSMTTLARLRWVYDLSVSAPHTFFAGGVLVHNKRRAVLHPYNPLAGL